MRIAILEDDPSQSELMSHWLNCAGYETMVFATGEQLLSDLHAEAFGGLLLDWNMPDISGLEVLRSVRQSNPSLPVLFCSIRSSEQDVAKALREGADDYLVKPLRQVELLERLQTVLRRYRRVPEAMPARIDPFEIDVAGAVITRAGRPIHLAAKDFDLALLFLRNIGRLLHRSEIREAVWPKLPVASRTMDTHVCRIRAKLMLTEEHGWRLAAVYRHGYRLERMTK